ncbi:MAG: FKBP-type peptidyl-prolyl cis-trans isomerase [Polyangiaceae bacterium]|nr:FKBP-type peptidyl-prolyl cis-trans isomerase [Polyangiaceae bacterium]
MKDLVVGKGAEAKTGDTVRVHYVGTLTDGKEFDASRKHNPDGFTFPLGAGRVIKGWDQGVVGMKVGGKRKLTIPPSLGYGARGAPPVIPPNATLIFEIELLEVKSK